MHNRHLYSTIFFTRDQSFIFADHQIHRSMKKYLLLLLIALGSFVSVQAQKFALIDMEYIMRNIPAYERAGEQLNQIQKVASRGRGFGQRSQNALPQLSERSGLPF